LFVLIKKVRWSMTQW